MHGPVQGNEWNFQYYSKLKVKFGREIKGLKNT